MSLRRAFRNFHSGLKFRLVLFFYLFIFLLNLIGYVLSFIFLDRNYLADTGSFFVMTVFFFLPLNLIFIVPPKYWWANTGYFLLLSGFLYVRDGAAIEAYDFPPLFLQSSFHTGYFLMEKFSDYIRFEDRWLMAVYVFAQLNLCFFLAFWIARNNRSAKWKIGLQTVLI